MSIDNLPTELPLEASHYFSDHLFPHLMDLAHGKRSVVLENATMTTLSGELTEPHASLKNVIAKHVKTEVKKRVDWFMNDRFWFLDLGM